jgi:hypothetical protein
MSPATKRLLIGVVAAIAGSRVPDARADTGAILVVGRAKPQHRDVVTSAVTQTVLNAKWSVDLTPFSPKQADAVMACVAMDRPWVCVAPTARDKGIQRMVVVQVDHDRAGAIVLTAQLLVAGDSVPPTDRRVCDHCTAGSLARSANTLTRELLRRAAARPTAAALAMPAPATLVTGAPPAPRSRVVPALLIGAGALGIAGGTWYSLSRESPETREQPRYLYSAPAIGVAALGGIVLGIGIYAALRPTRATSPSTTPTVTLLPGGGAVGWTTRF